MKTTLLIAILALCPLALSSQTIKWTYINSETSEAQSVSQLSDNILLVTGLNEFELSLLSFLKPDGSLIKHEILGDWGKINHTIQLSNHNLIHFTNTGNIIQTDPEGLNLLVIEEIGDYIITIEESIDGTIYLISSRKVLYKFDPELLLLSVANDVLPSTTLQIGFFNDNQELHVYRESENGQYFLYLMKISLTGEKVWEKKYDLDAALIHDVLITGDNQIYLCGQISSGEYPNHRTDGLIYALDDQGQMLWKNSYLATSDFFPYKRFDKILQSPNGSLFIIGTNGSIIIGPISSFHVVSIDQSGSVVWETDQAPLHEGHFLNDIILFGDDLVVCGNGNLTDYPRSNAVVIRIDCKTNSLETIVKQGINIYPNPSTETLFIDTEAIIYSVDLMDLSGKLIQHFKDQDVIDISFLVPNSYVIRLSTDRGTFNQIFNKY